MNEPGSFSEIAAVGLHARTYIPAHLQPAYDRMVQAALKHAILPEVEEALELADLRPLADVVELHGYSRGVPA